ncbi:hypothetical protein [Paractinoplanes lichenicola]|uniref:Uncharacterized protein n=1 Tax=Paractinoplanes lichenicola TaxID=2802976 RepID=A0ABS1VWB1_9ACTN|nr:hypothetical protein [Actinoplanes lichenicola]MBL7258773.1 hypothetical protein [Actinoplanes lichenicola]
MTSVGDRMGALGRAVLPLRGSRRGLDNVRLVGWTLSGFVLTVLVTSAFDVAREPGCQGFRVFLRSLLLRQGEPPNCDSVPFLVDIPTVILSLTSPFAVIGYLTILRRLEGLVPELQRTGLLPDDRVTAGADETMQQWLLRLLPRGWKGWLLFAVSAAMTIWLYSRNLQSGGIFEALANPAAPEAVLRERWWADYRDNPLLAVWCVFVGTVGVHFALASAWMYALVGQRLLSRRKRNLLDFRVRYVPRWRDKSFGWAPATSLIMLSYATAINFAISMIAVFDMLQGGVNRVVAAGFATLGVCTDLALIVLTLRMIVKAHHGVRADVRAFVAHAVRVAEIRRGQRDRRRRGTFAAPHHRVDYVVAEPEVDVILAARDAESWPPLPIANLAVGIVKVAPGIYAIIQLSRTLAGGLS